jgi:hypothetical protein
MRKNLVPRHHINIEVLSLGPFPVHKLKDWVGWISALEQDACDLKQPPVQMRGTTVQKVNDFAGIVCPHICHRD